LQVPFDEIGSGTAMAVAIEVVRTGDGRDRPDEIYFARVMTAVEIENDRMILIKIGLRAVEPRMQRRRNSLNCSRGR